MDISSLRLFIEKSGLKLVKTSKIIKILCSCNKFLMSLPRS